MKQQLIDLLNNEVGFEVNLFDMLCIYQLEDSRWVVALENDKSPLDFDENIFNELEEAVDFFLDKRTEMKLGYDFEKEQL